MGIHKQKDGGNAAANIIIPAYDLEEKTLRELGVDNNDYPDFVLAIKILEQMMQRKTITTIAKELGVPMHTLHTPRWQMLFKKARLLDARPRLEMMKAQTNRVLEKWPEVVDTLLDTATDKTGKVKGFEKNGAAELIYNIFIQPLQEQEHDESPERNYLNRPHNFNPSAPILAIQAQAGSTINVGKNEKGEIVILEEPAK